MFSSATCGDSSDGPATYHVADIGYIRYGSIAPSFLLINHTSSDNRRSMKHLYERDAPNVEL